MNSGKEVRTIPERRTNQKVPYKLKLLNNRVGMVVPTSENCKIAGNEKWNIIK